MHRAREHAAQAVRVGTGVQCPNPFAGSRGPASGQQFEGDRAQREDVGRRAPGFAGDSFGRAVRAPDRRSQADTLQRVDDTEPGRARFFRRHEDVARMQRAVADPCRAREVDRAGELRHERQRRLERRRRVMAHRDVKRFGRDVLFRAVGDGPFDAGGERLDDRGMEEARLGRARQLFRERLCLFGSNVETEDLDGHETVSRRLVGSEHGPKRAHTNLVQHPERTECGRRREGGRIVSGQYGAPRAGSEKCNTRRRSVQIIFFSRGFTRIT